MIGTAGATAALMYVLMKFVTELYVVEKCISWLIAFFLIATLITAFFTLVTLNLPMKYYDQLEAIPIYQAFFYVLNMTFGLSIIGEATCYSWR